MIDNIDTGRDLWVDHLRSAITVLVVAHHSSLAYTSFASFNPSAYILSTHPIADPQRWKGIDIFENYNDIFFMFLMFFIGGLFVVKSIGRKGPWHFVKDRFLRLFLPFLFMGTLLMLIAHFPAWMIAKNNMDIPAYLQDFFTTEAWPVGPPWFIWVLFVFNLLFAVCYPWIRRAIQKAADRINGLGDQPLLFFLLLFSLIWLLYVPVALRTGAGNWTGLGPFDFQLSRILAYAGYFLLGCIIGAAPFNKLIFAPGSALIRNWKSWLSLSLLLYTLITLNSEFNFLAGMVQNGNMKATTAWLIYYTIYAANCAASCLAFICFFRAKFNTGNRWWRSLSDNAYLIYLLHYVPVIWMQYLLMTWNVPAILKFTLVFVLSLLLSWCIASLMRKNALIRRWL